jgi:FtsH-binding integral membrane protein
MYKFLKIIWQAAGLVLLVSFLFCFIVAVGFAGDNWLQGIEYAAVSTRPWFVPWVLFAVLLVVVPQPQPRRYYYGKLHTVEELRKMGLPDSRIKELVEE